MCLDLITKRAEEMPAAAIGYKVVRPIPGPRYQPLYFPIKKINTKGDGCLRGGGWAISDLDAEGHYLSGTARDLHGNTYPPGVHAFTGPDDYHLFLSGFGQEKQVMVRVMLRGPICAGRQSGMPVVVYREMTILEEVDPDAQEGD